MLIFCLFVLQLSNSYTYLDYLIDFPLKHENQDRDSFNWLKLDIDIVRKKRQKFLILGKNPDPAESRSFMKRFDANFA